MTVGDRPARLEPARIEWIDAGQPALTPRSVQFDDIYFSGDGLGETEHVFLKGTGLEERFGRGGRLTLAETGFGAGLNMLAAWNLWRRTPKPAGSRLELLSYERFPLSVPDLARAHAAWPELARLSSILLRRYPPLTNGFHRLALDPDVALTLAFGDALAMLGETKAAVDIWFLDGFAPAKNPDLWSQGVFDAISRLSTQGARLATYTVANRVRHGLTAAGFEVEKRPGYGRKREMLCATLSTPLSRCHTLPWYQSSTPLSVETGARIAVIGGGIAGAALAHALMTQGFAPEIFDENGLAAGASGNPVGLIMPRLDLGEAPAGRFFRAAYISAVRTIDLLAERTPQPIFWRCGVLLRATDDAERIRQRKLSDLQPLPEDWIRTEADGLFFPQAGVIDPASYVCALAGDAPVHRLRVRRLERANSGWLIETDGGSHGPFSATIIANGRDALRFVQARSLPLTGVEGQLDAFPQANAPAYAVAAGAYIAPIPAGGVALGATFRRIDAFAAPVTRLSATSENLENGSQLADALIGDLDPADARPRTSVRCQTPDRLPIAGPMPDWGFYSGAYDSIRTGARLRYPDAQVQPGLFVVAGLGSRGLVTAPLLADSIACALSGAPIPFETDIAGAVHPARFFIRDLKRAKITRPDG